MKTHVAREKHITLEQVLYTLRKMLGYSSWITNGFIKGVKPLEKGNPTVCISRDGMLYYNPKFWAEKITTPNRVDEILLHELLHKVFGDFSRSIDEVENFAADVVINYTVDRVLGHCDLPEAMYQKKMPQGLLRPGSERQAKDTKFAKVHKYVWNSNEAVESDASIAQVYQALRVLLPKHLVTGILLLGSHGGEDGELVDEDGNPIDLSMDMHEKGKIAQDLLEKMSKEAGYGETFLNVVIRAIKAECTLKQEILRDFAVNSCINKIRSYYEIRTNYRSVIPKYPSRRDLALMAAGCPPPIWTNEMIKQQMKNRGLIAYVDVSGSQWGDLPEVLGVLQNFKSVLHKVFQFSNDIQESSLQELCEGGIKSTGGTDFNCIIDHAIDHGFKKIVVFTDGYADADDNHKAKSLEKIEKACVILTGKCTKKNNFFSEKYMRTHSLEELCR